ncbi:MAG: hypothetical protein CEE38_19695 [Planctomycetes bacterium B3_Pla]|nr:MAG: hypothetical protein CEE38_19695 [Planctomycetes bacterium B3_Pla]
MTKPNSQTEKPEDERRYDPKLLKKGLRCDLNQYEMLRRCSDRKDMTEWNKWRESHPNIDVWLQGKDFSNWYLKGAYFHKGQFVQGYDYTSLGEVHLENTFFREASLEDVRFIWSRLQNAKFANANLSNAKFEGAHIQGTNFYGTYLQDANFRTVLIDNETSFWDVKVNNKTDFLGVSLGNIRIHPKVKQLLEYNIRRKNWEEWYKEHSLLKWLVKSFWLISDYGISTKRIVFTFFGLALFFAVVYSNLAYLFPPGIVSNMEVEPHLPLWHYGLLVFLRPIYFSVVTMTTLGFGDMYANAQSIWGHILLTMQVILGYVLLGALVTRFAVLFTAGGPAGEFANEKEE